MIRARHPHKRSKKDSNWGDTVNLREYSDDGSDDEQKQVKFRSSSRGRGGNPGGRGRGGTPRGRGRGGTPRGRGRGKTLIERDGGSIKFLSRAERDKMEEKSTELEEAVLGNLETALTAMGAKVDDSISSDSDSLTDNSDVQEQAITTTDRKPAWHDEDDEGDGVLEVTDSRYKTISKSGESEISRSEYTRRLKSKFEAAVGEEPNWAKLDKHCNTDSESEDEESKKLKTTTGDFVSKEKIASSSLLQYKPVTHANKQQPHKAPVTSVKFHPTSQVVMTAGKDNTLSFFQVDGNKNEKIQSVFLENFPIYSARLCESANEVILTSKHKSFYSYDMISGKLSVVQPIRGLNDQPMSRCEVSPDGSLLAFIGSYGYIHLISRKSKELIDSVKMNGEVSSICFSLDSQYIYSFGDEGQVYVWDIRNRYTCTHRFTDEGCVRGTALTVHTASQLLACGSESGFVNLYGLTECMKSANPKPLKSFSNLLTRADIMCFNSDAQMLAIASSDTMKACRVVNITSRRVYQNFPLTQDTMQQPTCIDFSPNSGFMAVGSRRGVVCLYRMLQYDGY